MPASRSYIDRVRALNTTMPAPVITNLNLTADPHLTTALVTREQLLPQGHVSPYGLVALPDGRTMGVLAFLDPTHLFALSSHYAARTLLGIAHIHELGMVRGEGARPQSRVSLPRHHCALPQVYRDLKPENILMDELGRTRISDLGLACKVTPELKGTCGTRGYMAPEMLKRDADGHRLCYDQTVDWFSFGCVVFEFFHGKSPFRSNRAKNYRKKEDGVDDDVAAADGGGDGDRKKKDKKNKKKGKGGGKHGDVDPITLATLEMEIE